MHEWICLNGLVQTNGKLISIFFQLMADNKKYSNEQRVVNMDLNATFYISMDSFRQALQRNGKIFKFLIRF